MGLAKLSCFVWGHHVDNHIFKHSDGQGRHCRCGAEYLAEDRSVTRVRHTLSCFFGKHDYEKLVDRNGCHEYVCTQCGHPLLFDAERDPYAATPNFKKKVRYLCGLFGHRVRHVATRDGLEEYACFCGHSFLKGVEEAPPSRVSKIRHPAICVVSGHFLRYLAKRGGYAEYVCVNCGHSFCFAYHAANEAGAADLTLTRMAGTAAQFSEAAFERDPITAARGRKRLART